MRLVVLATLLALAGCAPAYMVANEPDPATEAARSHRHARADSLRALPSIAQADRAWLDLHTALAEQERLSVQNRNLVRERGEARFLTVVAVGAAFTAAALLMVVSAVRGPSE